ncbi:MULTISPECIES: helix-turn-helix transcriptional regulator [Sphingomonadales]|jgi:DNA-binding CsgD family transcriptional regulator|uniref:Response regulator receiver protein n=1 Tax=Rhizorhabdus wittichii (strain DSM 6014 / CCUG 31198 / JCM 15750 / NBRC 105917 / EY 4224 / RW1) TaxID=392499 RepID=A0A9J9H8X7_RHIWR|nr:response regulator receiver protein [Rhizorhabdus wittichii RW1]ARR56091.1 helix-turn-helix transcriptional regulator [Rhizorhabdus wittichii DC-6]
MSKQSFTSAPSASLYEKILSCDGLDDIGGHILEPLVDALGATSAVFIQMFASPLGDRHFGAHSYVGHKPGSVGVYLDEFHKLDPVMRPAMDWLDDPKRPLPNMLTGSFKRILEQNSYYGSSFLQPFDVGHVVAFVLPMNTAFETQLACVGFHRRLDDPAFSADQIGWFERLGPALRSVLYVLAAKEAITLSETIAMAAKEAGNDFGFLIFDEDLVIRNANARGMEDIGVGGADGRGSSLLGEIKQKLLGCDRSEGGALTFRADMPKPVEVEIRNFHSADGRLFHLVVTNGAGKHHAIDGACRKFGLTEREAEVVSRIAAGKCNASLSQELGISLRTGENHLRSIYRKVGVGSRTQLLSRLLQIH